MASIILNTALLIGRNNCIICMASNSNIAPLSGNVWVREDWSLVENNVIYKTDTCAADCQLWLDSSIMTQDRSRISLSINECRKSRFSDNMGDMIIVGLCNNGDAVWIHHCSIHFKENNKMRYL